MSSASRWIPHASPVGQCQHANKPNLRNLHGHKKTNTMTPLCRMMADSLCTSYGNTRLDSQCLLQRLRLLLLLQQRRRQGVSHPRLGTNGQRHCCFVTCNSNPSSNIRSAKHVHERMTQSPSFSASVLRAWEATGLKELLHHNERTMPSDQDCAATSLLQAHLMQACHGVTAELTFYEKVRDVLEAKGNSNTNMVPMESSLLYEYESIRAPSSAVACVALFGNFFHTCPLDQSPLLSSKTRYHSDKRFQKLMDLSSLISGIDNDLQSYQKQDDSDWNSITIRTVFGGKTLSNAFDEVCQRHFHLVQAMRALGRQLQEDYPTDSNHIAVWVNIILPSVHRGFVSWQSHVKRYRNEGDDATNGTLLTDNLLERLFPGEPYHQVSPEDGTFPGMNVELYHSLHSSLMEWAASCRQIGSTDADKYIAVANPALLALLLFPYCNRVATDLTQEGHDALIVFVKFFTFLAIVDDMLENPQLHVPTKHVFLQCIESMTMDHP